jgi:formylglycine-generating enzyme required for sulfatase activity
MPALRPLTVACLAAVALAACGDDGPSAEVLAELAARAAPATWEDIDPAQPGARLRDPRTGLVFRRVPAGEFTMGGTGLPHEGPPHPVRLSRAFLLAETEVTAGAWRRYVAQHGGAAAGVVPDDDLRPMGGVSWDDAVAFCQRYGYRLPTEAEWEYACRAGADGDAAPWRSTASLLEHAWFHANAAELGPQRAAQKRANAFGLFDMLGNVWEWTADGMAAYPRDGALVVDPPPAALGAPGVPEELQGRVLRGGSFFTAPAPEPSQRMAGDPAARTAFYGFRPAVDLPR